MPDLDASRRAVRLARGRGRRAEPEAEVRRLHAGDPEGSRRSPTRVPSLGEAERPPRLYRQSVWELERALDDDERAASAFLGLGAFGIVTWFLTLALAQALLPATSLAALLSVVFGIVGWRAAKQGAPREASTFVALVLGLALAALWVLVLGSLVLSLV